MNIKILLEHIECITKELSFVHVPSMFGRKEDFSKTAICAVQKWLELFGNTNFFKEEDIKVIEEKSIQLIDKFEKFCDHDIINRTANAMPLMKGKHPFEYLYSEIGALNEKKIGNESDEHKKVRLVIVALFAVLSSCLEQILQKETDSEPAEHLQLPIPQTRHVLTIILPVKETELVNRLRSEAHLTPQTVEKLFHFKQGVLYSTEDHWNDTYQYLFKNPHHEEYEHDVHYIKIRLDRPDERFNQESTMVKMFDAFKELAEKRPEIEVSERQPKESYENKGFYRV